MRTLGLILIALIAAACESEEYLPPPAIDAVELSESQVTLQAGDTARLQARAVAKGEEVPVAGFAWSTADSAVVRVVGSGASARLEARRAGQVLVKVEVAGKAATVLVQVNNPVPQVTALSPLAAAAGSVSVQLEVTGAAFATDAQVQWNGGALPTTYVSAGLLRVQLGATQLADEGTAQVTVSNGLPGGGSSEPLTFTMSAAAVAYVEIDQIGVTMTVGDTLRLRATARDAAGRELAGRGIEWRSSDAQTATISATGVVSARAVGSAVITAESEAKLASLLVYVMAPQIPTPHITALTPDSALAGSDFVITVHGSGFRNNISHAYWNDTSVPAEVISDSVMHITLWQDLRYVPATGTVRIYNVVPGLSGLWSNSRTFRIAPAIAFVSVTPLTAIMWPGETLEFTATAFDWRNQSLPGRAVTWETQLPNLLTINDLGRATAHAVGTSAVRARIDAVSGYATVQVLTPPSADLLVEAQMSSGPELWIVNPQNPSNRTRLMPGVYARDPAVSPDGNQIAFVGRDTGGNHDIYVANRDGTNVRRLTTHPALDDQPAWSPDGNTIAFRSRRSPYGGLEGLDAVWLMDADGSNQRGITITGFLAPQVEDPAFSPDGQRLYVAALETNFSPFRMIVMVYDLATGESRRLTNVHESSDDDPAASPDGSVVIVRRTGGSPATSVLQALDATSSGNYYLFDMGPGRAPSWSADGRFVAFEVDDEQGRSNIHVTQPHSQVRKLIVGNAKNAAWLPRR